jgi:hypothetical protein
MTWLHDNNITVWNAGARRFAPWRHDGKKAGSIQNQLHLGILFDINLKHATGVITVSEIPFSGLKGGWYALRVRMAKI